MELRIVYVRGGSEYRMELEDSRWEDLELLRGSLYGLALKRQVDVKLGEIFEKYPFLEVVELDFDGGLLG